MIAAHATQWPNTEKSIMEFHDKKKREDAINIQNAYQKWNCPLDLLKKNLTVFCHFVTVKNTSNGHKKVSLRQTIKIKALMSLLVKVGLFKIKWGL